MSGERVRQRLRRWPFLMGTAMAIVSIVYVLFGSLGERSPFSPRFGIDGMTINAGATIRHDKPYRLTLWETDVPLPKRPHQLEIDVRSALLEFADRYPQVRVEVELVPETEIFPRLEEAIRSGNPPDVVALPEPVADRNLQIPVTHYLPSPSPNGEADGGENLYYAAARDPWTVERELWGFPRWIAWQAWAGRDEPLREAGIDVDGAVRYGWTWDDVMAVATRWEARGSRQRFALNVHDPDLWIQLVANAGAPWWETVEGPLWSTEPLTKAAEFLRKLDAADAIPLPSGDTPVNRIVRLAEGRALVIGPVNPLLYHVLHDRIGDLVLLPVPHHAEHPEAASLVPSGYAVFRQEDYRGDDHLRAAMELAYFLSRNVGLRVAQKVGFLPASPRDRFQWTDRASLHYLARTFLLDYLGHFPRQGGRPAMRAYMPPPEAREALRSSLTDLWQRGASALQPGAWAEQTIDRLRPFMTNTAERSSDPGTDGAPR